MTTRIRTKFLAFPAILAVIAALLSWAAVDMLASHARLLERLSGQDLAKTQRIGALFDQLSRNHAAIYDLLADAEQGVEEGRIYELGQPMLDRIRGVLREVQALDEAFPASPTEMRLQADLLSDLKAYVKSAMTAIERSTAAPRLSRQFMRRPTRTTAASA